MEEMVETVCKLGCGVDWITVGGLLFLTALVVWAWVDVRR